MSDDKKEKKPDLELPELNELDTKSKPLANDFPVSNYQLSFQKNPQSMSVQRQRQNHLVEPR
jgi:hypothetical protein